MLRYLYILLFRRHCPHYWHRQFSDPVVYQFEKPRVRGRQHCVICGKIEKIKI